MYYKNKISKAEFEEIVKNVSIEFTSCRHFDYERRFWGFYKIEHYDGVFKKRSAGYRCMVLLERTQGGLLHELCRAIKNEIRKNCHIRLIMIKEGFPESEITSELIQIRKNIAKTRTKLKQIQ